MDVSEYWNAVRKRICIGCADGNKLGDCHFTHPLDCTLEQYFSLIVHAIERVDAPRVQDYTNELLPIVCAQCRHASTEKQCLLRDSKSCTLDRHYSTVIETLTSMREQQCSNSNR